MAAETKIVTIDVNGKPAPNPVRAKGTRHGASDTDSIKFQSAGSFKISFDNSPFSDCTSPIHVSPGHSKTCKVDVPGSATGVTYPYSVLPDAVPDVARERMAAGGVEPPEMIID